MAVALSLVATRAQELSPELARRLLIYTCALASIGASLLAPSAAASTVCMAKTAFMQSL